MGFFEDIGKKYRDAERYYAATGISVPLSYFILAFLVCGVLAAVLSVYVTTVLFPTPGADDATALSLVAFLSVMSLVLVIPVTLRDQRISAIDANLPDALKNMAVVLRSGGTVESALEETSKADYGPLTKQLKLALELLKKGRVFDDVLREAADNSGSVLFERVAIIISDARRAGAGIADVMTAIAEDAMEVNHLRRERKSRTMMNVVFLQVSSLLISPFIFGFVLTIVLFLGTGISCSTPGASIDLSFLNNLLIGFLALATIVASLAIGVIGEGKTFGYVIRAPVMVFVSLAVFEFGKRFGSYIVGGGGLC